jgi:hypothetical protein
VSRSPGLMVSDQGSLMVVVDEAARVNADRWLPSRKLFRIQLDYVGKQGPKVVSPGFGPWAIPEMPELFRRPFDQNIAQVHRLAGLDFEYLAHLWNGIEARGMIDEPIGCA